MRLPSIHKILSEATLVLHRFPVAVVVALIGTIAAMILVEYDGHAGTTELYRILLTSLLALPAALAVNLRRRYGGRTMGQAAIDYSMVAVVLFAFYVVTNRDPGSTDMLRFVLLNAVAHLSVAVSGFLGRGTTEDFWQFNKELFIRIVTALIFSVVLFGGLSGALAALEALFAFEIRMELYPQLACVIFGLFQTFFFLAGVPVDEKTLRKQCDFPVVLKVFTQYVLVPLVIIYLIILLSYEVKISIETNLPNGWVSNLIIGYGIAGTLSILLVHPIKESEGNQWIKTFARWFYRLLVPLVLLMWVAIGKRIYDYGLTIERVIVAGLAMWLSIISIWMILRPRTDIRVIPITLAVLTFLICLTAWPISKSSQRYELKTLFIDHDLMKNGDLVQADSVEIPLEARQRITSIVHYLMEYHGHTSLEPWFDVSTDDASHKSASRLANEMIDDQLGFAPESNLKWDRSSVEWYDYICKEAIPLADADWVIPIEAHGRTEVDTGFSLRVDNHRRIALYKEDEAVTPLLDPNDLFQSLIQNQGRKTVVGQDEMKQETATDRYHLTLYYTRLNGRQGSDETPSFTGVGVIRER